MKLKKLSLLLVAVLQMWGCATVGSYQADCEAQTSNFDDMVSCLKLKINSDWRRGMSNDPKVKLYLLKAEQLSTMIHSGETSEIDAKVELQNLYIRLKQIHESKNPIRTECRKVGGRVICTTK